MASEQMKIFTRTFDFLTWLLPATNHFPRAHRHTFTQRLLDAAFDFQERIEEGNARKGQARLAQGHPGDGPARRRPSTNATQHEPSANGVRRRCH